MNISVMKTSI